MWSNVTSLCCNNFAKKIFRVGKLSTSKINGGLKVKAVIKSKGDFFEEKKI